MISRLKCIIFFMYSYFLDTKYLLEKCASAKYFNLLAPYFSNSSLIFTSLGCIWMEGWGGKNRVGLVKDGLG